MFRILVGIDADLHPLLSFHVDKHSNDE